MSRFSAAREAVPVPGPSSLVTGPMQPLLSFNALLKE